MLDQALSAFGLTTAGIALLSLSLTFLVLDVPVSLLLQRRYCGSTRQLCELLLVVGVALELLYLTGGFAKTDEAEAMLDPIWLLQLPKLVWLLVHVKLISNSCNAKHLDGKAPSLPVISHQLHVQTAIAMYVLVIVIVILIVIVMVIVMCVFTLTYVCVAYRVVHLSLCSWQRHLDLHNDT